MSTYFQETTIHKFKDKHTLVKTLLYVKLSEMDISLPENDLNVLALFSIDTNKDNVIQLALDKEYVKSWQSCENKVSLLVKMGLLEKTDLKKRKISPEIYRDNNAELIGKTLKMHNIQTN